jgi:hypothetical protein
VTESRFLVPATVEMFPLQAGRARLSILFSPVLGVHVARDLVKRLIGSLLT